jgi:hypothetical protein
MKKILIVLMACISVAPSISAQPMSVYACSMVIERPYQGYQPGNYGGGSGPAVSENAAIEFWANQFVSEGFPRQIFEVVCTYQGGYTPQNQCVPSFFNPYC